LESADEKSSKIEESDTMEEVNQLIISSEET
jgi:hypothetical protein